MPTIDDIPAQMRVEPEPSTPDVAAVVNLEVSQEADVEEPEATDEPATTDEPEPIVEPASDPTEEPPRDEAGARGDEPAEAEAEMVDLADAEEALDTTDAQQAPAPPPVDEDLWEEAQPEPEERVKPPSRPPAPGELPERRVVVIDEHPDIDIEAGKEEPPPGPGSQEPGMADIGTTLDDEKGRKRRWRMFRKGGDR
jgi:hypothetical protein